MSKYHISMSERVDGKLTFRVIDTFNADSQDEANMFFDRLIGEMGEKADSRWIRMSCVDGGIPIVVRDSGGMQNVLNPANSSK